MYTQLEQINHENCKRIAESMDFMGLWDLINSLGIEPDEFIGKYTDVMLEDQSDSVKSDKVVAVKNLEVNLFVLCHNRVYYESIHAIQDKQGKIWVDTDEYNDKIS